MIYPDPMNQDEAKLNRQHAVAHIRQVYVKSFMFACFGIAAITRMIRLGS